MRGLPQYNFPYFYQVEAVLQLWGYSVINPARLDIDAGKAQWNVSLGDVIPDTGFTIEDALRRDFKEIMDRADAIVVLPGWEGSVGAQREVAFGTSIGRPVYTFDIDKPLSLGTDAPLDIQVDLQCYDVNRPRPGEGVPVDHV
jgi:hypothetical protein